MNELTKRQQEEVSMIKNKGNWPLLYCLPLKRRKPQRDEPSLGVALFVDPTEILLESLDTLLTYSKQQIDQVPRKKYENAEAMVLDGWVVD